MPAKKDEQEKTTVPAEETTTGGAKVAEETPEEEETVVVSKADLQGFLNRLNTLEEDNKRLIAVADKGRLAHERERAIAKDGAPLIRTVKLTRLDSNRGPLIIAWKMLANESYVDGNRLVEKQEIEVYKQDGTTEKMRLIDFYRRQNKQTIAEIIKRSLNEKTGETEVEVELKDGERITLGLAYVN